VGDIKAMILTFILGIIFGVTIGWGLAHNTIATESKRLGKFYVNDDIFTVTSIKKCAEDAEDKQ